MTSEAADSGRARLRRVPGGLVASRVAVERRGGLTAVAAAAATWGLGALLGWLVGGPAGGAMSFALKIVAAPLLPLFGVPIASDTWRITAALVASAVMWFAVGQRTARRTSRRAVVGWREWIRDIAPVAGGIALGALASLALAAMLLLLF